MGAASAYVLGMPLDKLDAGAVAYQSLA